MFMLQSSNFHDKKSMLYRFYPKKTKRQTNKNTKHQSGYKNRFMAFFKISYISQIRKGYTLSGNYLLNSNDTVTTI